MDELIQHVFHEIAYEGDLGCNISRLRELISGYHSQHSSLPAQNVDDAYCAYVWAIVAQHPDVVVGTVPAGVTAEVFITPQASAKRKAKGKGEKIEESPTTISLIPIPDAALRPLEDLRREYGEDVRIALDSAKVFVALTGTHVRSNKLSGMVYTSLQFIARGREQGISVLELGKKSGYDQKTCFYLVKQLVELDLVVKRRNPGISSNICVHKHFFDTSEVWQQIVREEAQAEMQQETVKDEPGEEDDDDDGQDDDSLATVQFEPIDSRHLSSLPLIRARITKLLKNSPNGIQPATNLLPKLGFLKPVKTDRRFFQVRLRELVEQGIIERVQVMHPNRDRFPNRRTICIRLVNPEEADLPGVLNDNVPRETLKINQTLHKQIVNLLDEAGTKGMTLSELSDALCNFDRRIVELILSRQEERPPPPHLSDLGIAQVSETQGRERRYKYFTMRHYQAMAAREGLNNPRYSEADVTAAGGFLLVDQNQFYEEDEVLEKYVDEFKGKAEGGSAKTGVAAKKRRPKNPILPDGTVKKGRPRKHPLAAEGERGPTPKRGKKRKSRDGEEDGGSQQTSEVMEPAPKRKRGRPPKQKVDRVETSTAESVGGRAGSSIQEAKVVPETPLVPKRRGRPPKNKKPVVSEATVDHETTSTTVEAAPRKKRGRPRKSAAPGSDTVPELASQPSRPGAMYSSEISTVAIRGSPSGVMASEIVSQLASDIPSRRLGEAPEGKQDIGTPSVAPSPRAALVEDHVVPSAANANDADALPMAAQKTRHGEAIEPLIEIPGDNNAALDIHRTLIHNERSLPVASLDMTDSGRSLEPHTQQPSPSSQTFPLCQEVHADGGPNAPPDHHGQLGDKRGQLDVNLSQSRREKEILRLVEDAGGILNTSAKDFYTAHAALVDSITQSGEVASTLPGTRIDKRTVEATLRELDTRQQIKIITTTVQTTTGSYRPVRIAYLPTVSEDDVTAFVSSLVLQRFPPAAPVKALDDSITVDPSQKKKKPYRKSSTSLSTSEQTQKQDPEWLERLLQFDDDAIHDAFMSDKNTLAQSHGFIIGRAARARELHLATMRLLESAAQSPHIVSREDRIIVFSLYFTELPISTYCALVASLERNDELVQLLDLPDGRLLPVDKVAPSIHSSLEIRRWRSRQRFLELLEMLSRLHVVEPLQPSTSDHPAITCAQTHSHPTAYDPVPVERWTPPTSPMYWRINRVAPLHLWALSQGFPPFWKNVPVQTIEQCTEYWAELKRVSTNREFAKSIPPEGPDVSALSSGKELGKSLRRPISWRDSYMLSWAQSEYLNRFVDVSTGTTPLQDENDGEARLHQICRIVGASKDVVHHFFDQAHDRYRREHAKAQRKAKRAAEAKAKEAQSKVMLAKRAEQARIFKEQLWEEMVHFVHPEPMKDSAVTRLRRLRSRFMQSSGKDRGKWEAEIAGAIQEADIAAKKVLSSGKTAFMRPALGAVPLPPVVSNPTEKAIEDLIASQGTRIPLPSKPKKSKKGKDPDTDKTEVTRRHRFQWTRDFDELARDAAAIIKARCRSKARTEYGVVEQIFPSIPRNSVRQRITHLRETPGSEAYMQRLEDKWYELWIQHRGTPALPDDDPESPTNFDCVAHIKFLRKHIDKNALRVGFLEVDESIRTTLPSTVEELHATMDVIEKPLTAPTWDFVWSGGAEEGREKQLAQHPFLNDLSEIPIAADHFVEELYVADAAVKMAMGSPNDTYDPQAASRLLESVGEEPVQAATKNLLARGALSKIVRDPQKSKPGRVLKISESSQNALGGAMSQDLFQDAQQLEDLLTHEEDPTAWREWSLLSSEGDLAALLELVSENKIDFKIDTSRPQAARPTVDWNSKKADDDDFETDLLMRFTDAPSSLSLPVFPESTLDTVVIQAEIAMDLQHEAEHGRTPHGGHAFCQKSSNGLIDCEACLCETAGAAFRTLEGHLAPVAVRILDVLRGAGSEGLTKDALNTLSPSQAELLPVVVNELTDAPVPLAYWTGYTSVVLVSADHIRPWTVTIVDGDQPKAMVLPRRWLDIHGMRINDVWEAALRAVVGIILLRPGVSQSEIRWRLRSVYDRQEVNELLQHLLDAGYVVRRGVGSDPHAQSGPPDDREEHAVSWFLGDVKHWYHL
ncbi:hypothetical protein IEO21_00245 [Rhodonia placenta]|uniref:Uncharacterized protein n=1 Tax=Rhodonia placenta TaxID=104341 RepID=A0A8H7U6K2_9APHY|nr:hypothetical protein IEO21_00245 [Postia placenta]